MIGHKTSLSKYTKIEIMPRILPDHKGMKLETEKKLAKLQIRGNEYTPEQLVSQRKN